MIVFSETEFKNLFVQGQIDSGDLSIYLCIVYLYIKLKIDAQSLNLYVKLSLSFMSEFLYGRAPTDWNDDFADLT